MPVVSPISGVSVFPYQREMGGDMTKQGLGLEATEDDSAVNLLTRSGESGR